MNNRLLNTSRWRMSLINGACRWIRTVGHNPTNSALLIAPLLLSALTLRLPGVIGDLSFDRAAITAIRACGSEHSNAANVPAEIIDRYSPDKPPWLKIVAVRCMGKYDATRASIREALAASDSRLDSMRSMEPYDAPLARFAAAKYPYQAEAQFWLGDALIKQDDPAGAIAAYERGLGMQSANGDIWLSLGTLYEGRGNLQAAVSAYDQACRLGDRGSNGCPGAGQVYLRLGRYELAAERYQASINQLDRTWLPSEQGLVTALLALGRTKEAIPHLAILAASGSSEAQEVLKRVQRSSK